VDELLAIGEFSARSCLSAKMLRRYAAAGLLVPAAIDAWSGYRYYTPGQLGQARLIRLLRQAQIPLSEIAVFLADPGPAQLRRWGQALDQEVRARRAALAAAARELGMPAAAAGTPAPSDSGYPVSALTAGSAIDRGPVRETNQDALLSSPPLFAVADGMGAPPGGEIASQLALEALQAHLPSPPDGDGLADAIRAANAAIWQRADADPAMERMGATLTAVVVHISPERTEIAVANAGDSRAYLLQDGQLTQLTRDDSLVQDLLDAGKLTSQQAAGHPQRSLLTRALGLAPTVEPGLSRVKVADHARLLLCTDGLTAHASDGQIAALLCAEPVPGQAAASLVQLANHNGGSDNTAVIVVDISPAPRAIAS
jgi:serine/threonine protein phosphatase PrpC